MAALRGAELPAHPGVDLAAEHVWINAPAADVPERYCRRVTVQV